MKKLLIINIGSTSSKLSYYNDRTCEWKTTVNHPVEDLKKYPEILEQYDYRYEAICNTLKEANIDYMEMDAIVSRGGHTRPIKGGTYLINDVMMAEIKTGNFGRHPCDIGVYIAAQMAKESGAMPLTVDPPVTDELTPIARYSGLPEAPRKSQFHALNHRAIAKRYAEEVGKPYDSLRLIGVHIGGGTTVAVHKDGQMVDASNGLYGGPFSGNRTGDVPGDTLVKMCFSGKYTEKEMMSKLNGTGGLTAYLNESDIRVILGRIEAGDALAAEVLDAMIYQICKEIGAFSTVLKGVFDAIIISGGIANSSLIVDKIKESIGFLGSNIIVYPGEEEMEALAFGAFEGLERQDIIKVLS